MTNEELETSISLALREGAIEKALKLLLEYTQKYDQGNIEDAISLKAFFINAKRQYERKGIITKQEYDLAFSKTVNGIQAILGDGHSGQVSFKASGIKKRIVPYFIVILLAVGLLITGYFFWHEIDVKSGGSTAIENKDTAEKTEIEALEEIAKGKEDTLVKTPIIENSSAPVAGNEPKGNISLVKEKPPNKTFKVKVLMNASCASSKIYVDGKLADVIESTPLVKTIRVIQKSEAYVFEIRDGKPKTVTKLIHSDGQRVIIPCD